MTNMTPEEAIKQITKHFDGCYPWASEQEKFDFVLAIINQQRQQAVDECLLALDGKAEAYECAVEVHEVIPDLLAEVERLRQLTEWYDLETAPETRDGDPILLGNRKEKFSVVVPSGVWLSDFLEDYGYGEIDCWRPIPQPSV